jgi:hypothetical protein
MGLIERLAADVTCLKGALRTLKATRFAPNTARSGPAPAAFAGLSLVAAGPPALGTP